MSYTLHLGDCKDVMAAMPANSVDSIICDPPYMLNFMGKAFDKPKDNPAASVEVWAEALRVAKPGAYLLAFGGDRTHHRLMVAIEDAGWQLKTCLYWIFGSGFPKSTDISKQLDKAAGAEREVIGRKRSGIADGPFGSVDEFRKHIDITAPATDAAKRFAGYGTALKPAAEIIVMAMKPVDQTYANNALVHGVAGLNVDGCRIAHDEECKPMAAQTNKESMTGNGKVGQGGRHKPVLELKPNGRWPANLILDEESARLLDEQSGERVTGGVRKPTGRDDRGEPGFVMRRVDSEVRGHSDTHGGASRFFYCAKSSSRERNEGLQGMEKREAGVGFRSTEKGEYLDFVYPMPAGLGAWLRAERKRAGLSSNNVAVHFPSQTGGLTGCVRNWELEFNRPTPEQWRTLRQVIGFDDRYDEVMTTTRAVDRKLFDDRERPIARNTHITVKPLELMRWLCRLTKTPWGGVVLDPFCGSGSTGVAAVLEGRSFIGIDTEAEYLAIAEPRLAAASAQPMLFPLPE